MKRLTSRVNLLVALTLIIAIWTFFDIFDNVIKIGVITSLSKRTAAYGISMRNAVRLAAEEINASGGINGRKLKLLIEDDGGDGHRAALAARDLIYRDKVSCIVGALTSDTTMKVQRVCERAHVPMIVPTATHPFISRIGFKYTFRCIIDDILQAEALSYLAAKRLGLHNTAILHDESDYSSMGAWAYAEKAAKYGLSIPIIITFKSGAANFAKELKTIKLLKADGLVIWGLAREAALIARHAAEMGLKIPILGPDALSASEFLNSAGPATEMAYFTMPFDLAIGGECARKFVERYMQEFGTEPDSFAAYSYDGVKIAAQALSSALSAKIKPREALVKMQPYAGVTGITTFDITNGNTKSVALGRIEGGRIVVIGLWPESGK